MFVVLDIVMLYLPPCMYYCHHMLSHLMIVTTVDGNLYISMSICYFYIVVIVAAAVCVPLNVSSMYGSNVCAFLSVYLGNMTSSLLSLSKPLIVESYINILHSLLFELCSHCYRYLFTNGKGLLILSSYLFFRFFFVDKYKILYFFI